jgi:hypothetical protein
MKISEILAEAVKYDNDKFLARWKQEGFSYKDQIGDNGENWITWLEAQDPSKKKSYVNWMIIRYLSGGINRLEDIPARLVPALKVYDKLKITRKVKPEDADINKFKKLSDFTQMVRNNYGDAEVTSNKSLDKSKEQQFFADNEAELVYNTPEWKVVIPKTHAASCYFGKNTEWCTTATDNSDYFDEYSEDGPLYIILQKKTNKRWQFHFESEQYMDENDEGINFIGFFMKYPQLSKVFSKYIQQEGELTKVTADSTVRYYNKNGKLHNEDGPAIEYDDETKEWFVNGERHRLDGPAIERTDGGNSWYLNGKRHRIDGPAIEYTDGNKYWYVNDKLHRTNGPAVELTSGAKHWYLNGKRHRIDGPAEEFADGFRGWWLNGEKHRTDGPAEEFADGYRGWWLNGKRHRIDGPAIVTSFGTKFWWLHGIKYSEEDYNKKIAQMKAAGEI